MVKDGKRMAGSKRRMAGPGASGQDKKSKFSMFSNAVVRPEPCDFLSQLPCDVLQHILRFLRFDRLGCVAKASFYLRAQANDPGLWWFHLSQSFRHRTDVWAKSVPWVSATPKSLFASTLARLPTLHRHTREDHHAHEVANSDELEAVLCKCRAGDRVFCAPGTYQRLELGPQTPEIELFGLGGAGDVRFVHNGTESVLHHEAPDVRIVNVTFVFHTPDTDAQAGRATAAVRVAARSNLRLQSCTVTSNGAGIVAEGSCYLGIDQCDVVSTTSCVQGMIIDISASDLRAGPDASACVDIKDRGGSGTVGSACILNSRARGGKAAVLAAGRLAEGTITDCDFGEHSRVGVGLMDNANFSVTGCNITHCSGPGIALVECDFGR